MKTFQRKVTYRLYPNAAQEAALMETLCLHCRVYNTLLEENQTRFEAGEGFFGFKEMCRALTDWRGRTESLSGLNAQSLQVTAKRVCLAFAAFFRRVKAGDTPGYPRFKSSARYPGWGFKTYGDGWKLFPAVKTLKDGSEIHQHGKVRLSGIGDIPMRGKGRFKGTPVTAEVLFKAGQWFLSVTFTVEAKALARPTTMKAASFDWGLKTLLTIFTSDGELHEVENPRWLKHKLEAIQALQRTISEKERQAKERAGLDPDQPLEKGQRFPITKALKRLYRQLGNIHSKISRQRKDFYHKLANRLVQEFWFLGTEALAVKEMVSKAKAKEKKTAAKPGEGIRLSAKAETGTRRAIHDGAPSMLLGILKAKAEEAGSLIALAKPRKLKPTQRCHHCGKLVKKDLTERTHRCPSCGCACGRDENAAKTLYRWMFEGDFWSGTVAMGVLPPETHSIPA